MSAPKRSHKKKPASGRPSGLTLAMVESMNIAVQERPTHHLVQELRDHMGNAEGQLNLIESALGTYTGRDERVDCAPDPAFGRVLGVPGHMVCLKMRLEEIERRLENLAVVIRREL